MSNEEKITLENFNYENKGPQLNSPHSLKAIQTLGIEEKQLKKLSFEEYISSNFEAKKISSDLQKERYDNYLQKHEELINKAKEKRNQLISEKEEEKDKQTENKIYHCELHDDPSSFNIAFSKGKINPNCEICSQYAKKYEKLKERMKISIQLEIDQELLKHEKMVKQNNLHKKMENQEEKTKNNKLKDFQNKKEKENNYEKERQKRREDLKLSIEKKRKEKEEKQRIIMNEQMKRKKEKDLENETNIKEKEKKGLEVRKTMESLNEEQMRKLLNKQKMLEERDEQRKIKLEQCKLNNSKTLNETYALKKERVNKSLYNYDMKREEKNRKYFDTLKQKEERKAKYDKDLLMQRTIQTESTNKYNSDRLRRAIELEERLNQKRLESYNKKLNRYNQTERNNMLNRQEKKSRKN